MRMADAEKLQAIISETLPSLKKGMADYRHINREKFVPESLQLSLPWCGPASVAIQNFLREKYNVDTEVVINKFDHGIDPYLPLLTHVALRADNVLVDATPTQFMNLVGLTPEEAANHGLEHLYPESQAFVYDFDQYRDVANAFAEHAYAVDSANLVPRHDSEYKFAGTMRGEPLPEMQRVYQGIWKPDNYKPWPVEDRREANRQAAAYLAAHLNK